MKDVLICTQYNPVSANTRGLSKFQVTVSTGDNSLNLHCTQFRKMGNPAATIFF